MAPCILKNSGHLYLKVVLHLKNGGTEKIHKFQFCFFKTRSMKTNRKLMVRKIKMIGFLISDSKSDFSFEKMDAVKTF